MGAMSATSQIMGHQAQEAGVKSRNRAKLNNFTLENEKYKRDVLYNNAQWKNDVQQQDIEQDQVYQSMMQQWVERDQQLDELFFDADNKIEQAMVQMYENEYAGTQTGATAARLAGKGAKKLGQYKSEVLNKLMLAEDRTALGKESDRIGAEQKSRSLYEEIRFAPIHGPTPMAPELEAGPSKAGLILGLAMTGVGTAAQAGMFKAPDIGAGKDLGASFTDAPDLGLGTTGQDLVGTDWGIW